MDEVTESEVRDALLASDSLRDKLDSGQPTTHDELSSGLMAPHVIFEWVRQELTRRDAERAEREKPIDSEWCVANGAVCRESIIAHGVALFCFVIGDRTLEISQMTTEPLTESWCVILLQDDDCVTLRDINTRGAVLDLLAALKGGA